MKTTRVFDVFRRRLEEWDGMADAWWQVWKETREEVALYRFTRCLIRANRLRFRLLVEGGAA